jgi:hypothetical protein
MHPSSRMLPHSLASSGMCYFLDIDSPSRLLKQRPSLKPGLWMLMLITLVEPRTILSCNSVVFCRCVVFLQVSVPWSSFTAAMFWSRAGIGAQHMHMVLIRVSICSCMIGFQGNAQVVRFREAIVVAVVLCVQYGKGAL